VRLAPEAASLSSLGELPSLGELLASLGSALRVALPLFLLLLACAASATTPTALERAAEALFAASFGVAASVVLLSAALSAAAAALAWAGSTVRATLSRPRTLPLPLRAPPPGPSVFMAVEPLLPPTADTIPETSIEEPPARSKFEELRAKARLEYFSNREWRRWDARGGEGGGAGAGKAKAGTASQGQSKTPPRRSAQDEWARRVERARGAGE